MSWTLGNQTGTTTSASNPRTQNFNIGAAGNILIVFAESDDNAALDTAATFDGQEMTYVGGGSDGTHGYVQIYIMEFPHTGTCQFSVGNPSSNTVRLVLASFISSTGAGALSRQNSGNGSSTNPSLNVTGTVANSLMVGMVIDGYRTQVTQGANYTSLYQRDAGNWTFCEEYDLDTGGAGTIAVNFVHATSDTWYIVAASFKEAVPPITINLQAARLTAQGKPISMQMGGVTNSLNAAIITSSAPSATISAPPLVSQVNLNSASIIATAEAMTLQPGEVSISLDEAIIYFYSTLHKEVTVELGVAQITSSGQPISIDTPAGDIQIDLDAAQIIANGQDISITTPQLIYVTVSWVELQVPVASSTISLSAAQIIASGQSATIQAGASPVTINLQAAQIASTGKNLMVSAPAPGAIQINLGVATITSSGQPLSIQKGAVSISLSTAQIITTSPASTIQKGAVSISLITAQITSSGRNLDVQEGAVSVSLGVAQIVSNGRNITISAPPPGTYIDLQSARLYATAPPLDVQPGTATINLSVANIYATGKNISISAPAAGIQINFQAAHITITAMPAIITGGAVTISTQLAHIYATGEPIQINPPSPEPPSPAPCIPGGGGLLRVRQKNIIILLPEDSEKKRQKVEDEDLMILQ